MEALLNSSDFWYALWNSCQLSIPIVLGIVCVGTLGGYAFAKFHFKGRRVFLIIYILLMLMPFQVLLAPQYRLLFSIGLTKNAMAVILPNIFSPFGAYLIYNYAMQIEDESLEAARIDGAGELRIFASIALPQLKNGIAALVILNLVDTWNLVEQATVFLQEEFRYPLSVAMNAEADFNYIASVIFMIPLILVFLMGKDALIDGIGKQVVK